MAQLPPGYVDPQDLASVSSVLRSVLDGAGPDGLMDLLARIPGVRLVPASPKRFLHAATPASVWVGPEHQLVLVDDLGGRQLVHQHVVGGVTLARDRVGSAAAPDLVARWLVATVSAAGTHLEAAAALTAHRDLYGPGS